jgi:Neisseria PilC beta-propeller domain
MKPFNFNQMIHTITLGEIMKKSILFNVLSALGLLMAVSSAHAVSSFNPSLTPVGTAPQPAMTSPAVGSGSEYEFFAWHLNDKFKGNLDAYSLDVLGRVSVDPVWRSSTTTINNATVVGAMDAQTARYIGTLKTTTVNAVSTTVKAGFNAGNFALIPNPTNASATVPNAKFGATQIEATNVINYLRGDRSKEQPAVGGTLRERDSELGDIMHSSPIFVGAPRGGDGTAAFATFRTNNAQRGRRVYVGANDGMVHAFDAGTYNTTAGKFLDGGTGKEVFAYIPSMLQPRLKALSDPAYTHQYYVDGALASTDMKFADGTWHTVLVGTLGAGGKGLFALDVTNPDAATDDVAAAKILWEITPTTRLSATSSSTTAVTSTASTDYQDLGDTFSEPVLVKLNNNKWAMVVGNGYNSASGKAILYVIDPETGALIKSIQGGTSVTSGLSSPGIFDFEGNGTVDYVYAGDIEGKLWRFNLTSNDPAVWASTAAVEIAYGGNGQPIFGAPNVLSHPQGGLMVNFVTGAYLVNGDGGAWDIANKDVQNYAYGIWDGANTSLAIQNQEITHQTYNSGNIVTEVMVSSSNPVNYEAPAAPLHKGWKAKLPKGASVASDGAYVANGRFTFTMTNPAATDLNAGNWLLQLDFLTGGPGKIVYDLNKDGNYDDADRYDTPLTDNTIPVGLYLNKDLISQPVYASIGPRLDRVLYTAYQPGTAPPPSVGGGLTGGHFDADVFNDFTGILGLNSNGSGTGHIHQYSDLYAATGINYLAAANSVMTLTDTATSKSKLPAFDLTGEKFFVIVANADQSPLVSIRLNNNAFTAPTYPNAILPAQRTLFSLADLKTFSVDMPRNALSLGGLFPTRYDCVTGAVAPQTVTGFTAKQQVGDTPGKLGEWRNGALSIQILKASTPANAIRLNVGGKPEKGYVVTDAQYLLREYSLYWHSNNGKCNTESGWTASPPADTKVNATLIATGTMDPGNGNNASVVSVTTTTSSTPPTGFSAVTNATTYTITTTIYSDNNKVVTVTAKDASGNILGTNSILSKVSTDPGSSGGLDKQADIPGKNSKVTGRVNWSERFRNK